MAIQKSPGFTPTERLLARLCEKTFLTLWSWPNPFKADRKELCDLIVVFEEHIFVFFDRESQKFDRSGISVELAWQRWKKETIDKQIATALGAERYIRSGGAVYLDNTLQAPFPLHVDKNSRVHRIVVAHGAKEACKEYATENVRGSLAIAYGATPEAPGQPFYVRLDNDNIVHVLDSDNLELVLGELDTIADFVAYIAEKERVISSVKALTYCGEQDFLAHYMLSFDEATQKREIDTKMKGGPVDWLHIGEGEWEGFASSGPYKRRQKANKVSYFWDELLQHTGQNALAGVLAGNGNVFKGQSAIHEMAKETRFARRLLSERLLAAVEAFPDTDAPLMRYLTYVPSFSADKGYVFLQVKATTLDYNDYREKRRALLEVACAAARINFPALKMVIGIAVEPPRLYEAVSEEFILLDCSEWSAEVEATYREANKHFRFFETEALQVRQKKAHEFPSKTAAVAGKVGRNHPCPCGSGKKFKRCHGRN